MSGIVFARKTVAVGGVTVRRGEAWDADAEMVKQRPHLFSERPERVRTGSSSHIRTVPTVETATRAPGEVRKAPRRRTKKKTTDADTAAASSGSGDEAETGTVE